MDDILEALGEQHAELESIVAPLDDDGWARPSRCEGWTVSDVVLHLAQTDEMARASLSGRFTEHLEGIARSWGEATDVDQGAAAMVDAERGRPPAEVHERWRSGATELRSMLADCDPSRRVPWVVGELAARTLTTTRLAEAWIHTGDVAIAFGPLPPPPERIRHIARLAWRTLPYAFTRAGRALTGPVAFELEGPSGEAWSFVPDDPATTTIQGTAMDLCLVAGQRADASETGLRGEGPDAADVLSLVRTFA
jgi:uncharacterized protein (TIGR03084 family)